MDNNKLLSLINFDLLDEVLSKKLKSLNDIDKFTNKKCNKRSNTKCNKKCNKKPNKMQNLDSYMVVNQTTLAYYAKMHNPIEYKNIIREMRNDLNSNINVSNVSKVLFYDLRTKIFIENNILKPYLLKKPTSEIIEINEKYLRTLLNKKYSHKITSILEVHITLKNLFIAVKNLFVEDWLNRTYTEEELKYYRCNYFKQIICFANGFTYYDRNIKKLIYREYNITDITSFPCNLDKAFGFHHDSFDLKSPIKINKFINNKFDIKETKYIKGAECIKELDSEYNKEQKYRKYIEKYFNQAFGDKVEYVWMALSLNMRYTSKKLRPLIFYDPNNNIKPLLNFLYTVFNNQYCLVARSNHITEIFMKPNYNKKPQIGHTGKVCKTMIYGIINKSSLPYDIIKTNFGNFISVNQEVKCKITENMWPCLINMFIYKFDHYLNYESMYNNSKFTDNFNFLNNYDFLKNPTYIKNVKLDLNYVKLNYNYSNIIVSTFGKYYNEHHINKIKDLLLKKLQTLLPFSNIYDLQKIINDHIEYSSSLKNYYNTYLLHSQSYFAIIPKDISKFIFNLI